MGEYVLTLSCPDRIGIVHAVAAYLHQAGCNVLDSQQFGDRNVGPASSSCGSIWRACRPPATYHDLYAGFVW